MSFWCHLIILYSEYQSIRFHIPLEGYIGIWEWTCVDGRVAWSDHRYIVLGDGVRSLRWGLGVESHISLNIHSNLLQVSFKHYYRHSPRSAVFIWNWWSRWHDPLNLFIRKPPEPLRGISSLHLWAVSGVIFRAACVENFPLLRPPGKYEATYRLMVTTLANVQFAEINALNEFKTAC